MRKEGTPIIQYPLAGDSVTLQVEASAEYGDIRYQWSLNDVPLEGETSSALTIDNVSCTSPNGPLYTAGTDFYNCTVTDDFDVSSDVRFALDVVHAEQISEGEPGIITFEDSGYTKKWFVFVPDEDGEYIAQMLTDEESTATGSDYDVYFSMMDSDRVTTIDHTTLNGRFGHYVMKYELMAGCAYYIETIARSAGGGQDKFAIIKNTPKEIIVESPKSETVEQISVEGADDSFITGALEISLCDVEPVDISTPIETFAEDGKVAETVATLDISLRNIIAGTSRPVHDAASPVTISLTIEGLDTNAVYKVIRRHDGKHDTLDASVKGNTLTFSSDKFSVFTIVKLTDKPHEHSLVQTTAKSAACTADGYKEYWTCTDCGKVFSDATGTKETTTAALVVKATGHKSDAGIVTKAPTCTAAGTKTYKCVTCGTVLKTESISATGHAYGTWTKLNDNQHQRVCANDKNHVEKANHTWDNGKVTRAATTTAEGVTTYTCTTCGATRTASIAKLTVESVPMYRLYMPDTHEHFYTADTYERNVLLTERGWVDEGTGWYAPKSGDPVYRLFNPYTTDHHYTMDYNEYTILGNSGWNQEGIGWYSDPNQGVPLYRLFTPNLEVGAHHYTMDAHEKSVLIESGAWQDESVGWYGMK